MRSPRIFLSDAQNIIALLIVGFIFLVAFTAPWIAPPEDFKNPPPFRLLEDEIDPFPLPPDENLVLGTTLYYSRSALVVEAFHFDVFYSLVWGTRSVLKFGLVTAFSAAAIGVFVGAMSGYFGGGISNLFMRITDAFLAFPIIAGVWLFRVVMDMVNLQFFDYANIVPVDVPASAFQRVVMGLGIDSVMIALVLFSWMAYARIISVSVSTLKQVDFTLAAKSLGASNFHIIVRHLIPNAITPAIVLLARDIGGLVVLQAAFAFIGISGSVNSTAIPEWSRLLLLGREFIIGQAGNPFTYWWVYVPVTIALILFGIGWNMLGDGLNVALNPRTVYSKAVP
jgi:peptide/nickel transport system permease protein